MYKQVLLRVNDYSDDRKLQNSKCNALSIFYLEWDTTWHYIPQTSGLALA